MTEVISSGQRQGAASMVMYRLAGREYPLRTVAQCKVCQSPHRYEVEQQIIAGRVWSQIERHLKTTDPEVDLTARNIKDHYQNNHLPLEQEVGRRIIERRAEQMGRSLDTGVDSMVDGVTAAELVVQKGVEALQRGELQVDVKDMLAAAKLLETFGADQDGPDQAAYVEAFMVYHEVASQVMTGEQFERFGQALSRNQVLKTLVARYTQDVDEPEQTPASESVIVASPKDA
jgi:hypothetical protein